MMSAAAISTAVVRGAADAGASAGSAAGASAGGAADAGAGTGRASAKRSHAAVGMMEVSMSGGKRARVEAEDGRFRCPSFGCAASFASPQGLHRHAAHVHREKATIEQPDDAEPREDLLIFRGDGSQLVNDDATLVLLQLVLNTAHRLLLCGICGYLLGENWERHFQRSHGGAGARPTPKQHQHVQDLLAAHRVNHDAASVNVANLRGVQGAPMVAAQQCSCGQVTQSKRIVRKHTHDLARGAVAWTSVVGQHLGPRLVRVDEALPAVPQAAASDLFAALDRLLTPPSAPADAGIDHLDSRDLVGFYSAAGWPLSETICDERPLSAVSSLFAAVPSGGGLGAGNIEVHVHDWFEAASTRLSAGRFLGELDASWLD